MSNLKTWFGKRLRYLRRTREMTQEQLAESINVSAEFISNVERGVNAPSFETLEKLSKVLDVPVFEMFLFDEFRKEK
jgi:transcriptional regulator with XRE-family HTH domain